MIPKKPGPDLIRGGHRFSEKIMLKQQAKAKYRFNLKSFRLAHCALKFGGIDGPSSKDDAAS
jgi:hypothetical protein